MKALILCCALIFANFSVAQLLYRSEFYRLNATDFKIKSYFSSGAGFCFQTQTRSENLQNDTLFLRLVFETRFGMAANGCVRWDTIVQTMIVPEINYINVSTGIITVDQNDITLADTLWSMHDSTFNAVLGLADLSQNNLQLQVDQQQLTVTGSEEISHLQLIDLNGKQLVYQQGNTVDVSILAPGVYLLRVFSGGNKVQVLRWYKE
jgi:hypothetical protein